MAEEFNPQTHEEESPEQRSPESPRSSRSPGSSAKTKWETPNDYGLPRQVRQSQE